jgi:dethiobiotin synthetase
MLIPKRVFIAGIDTDVGKTVVSSIVTKAFNGIYFKPIQCGDLSNSDSMKVYNYLNKSCEIIPETYCFKDSLSPHKAALNEGIEIDIKKINLPNTKENLIIEGAGGVHTPLNNVDTYLDFVKAKELPVIVVVKHYLGALNHTLLTIESLKSRNIKILGFIFNGKVNKEYETYLCDKTKINNILSVDEHKEISTNVINLYAKKLLQNWKDLK